jgi:transposase-like protein
MGQILHKCATTTQRIRKEIQNSTESWAKLAKKYNVNPKTIGKWKHRSDTEDAKMGRVRKSTVLTELEEEAICLFRKTTELPLDDCYITLRDTIPNLSRSSLHRCLQRNDLSRLPQRDEKDQVKKKKFKSYPLGYIHIDITEVRIGKKKLYLFIAIDRVTKYVYAELHEQMTIEISEIFLKNTFTAFPYKIHTILTDNGIQFTYRLLPKEKRPKKFHAFDILCKKNGTRHRLTKFRHPWTNGQVERFNGFIKQATVKKYYYESADQLKKHLYDFIMAYNHGKRLKSLNFITPYEKIQKEWEQNPKNFTKNPDHYIVGLNK